MKKAIWGTAVFLLCMVLAAAGLCQGSVINLVADPTQPYAFEEGAPLLEIVFPRVFSSDCAILRMEGMTMMVDASMESEKMQGRIATAMGAMGVEKIDIAYNSHPHRDHINGFEVLNAREPLGEFLYCFPEDYHWRMRRMVRLMRESGVPERQVKDGDVITLGESGLVEITVIRSDGRSDWSDNDRSSMLMIQYGQRRFLLPGDNENRAQKYFAENPPACELDADILKYPHHGGSPMHLEFLEKVSPELCISNAASNVEDIGNKFLEERGVPYINAYKGLTRFRTDGRIWVVDTIYEPGADRELPYISRE